MQMFSTVHLFRADLLDPKTANHVIIFCNLIGAHRFPAPSRFGSAARDVFALRLPQTSDHVPIGGTTM